MGGPVRVEVLEAGPGGRRRAGRRTEEGGAPVHRAGVPRQPRRRPRGLDLRRAGEEDHHASGLPELRPHARAPLRRAARGPQGRQARAHRAHRVGRIHPPLLPGAHAPWRSRSPGATRSPRGRASPTAGSGARPTTRRPSWGRSAPTPTSTRPTRRTRAAGTATRQERVPFINHAIIHPPVDRNMAPGAPGGADRHLRAGHQGDGRRHLRVRGQGRRDGLGADPLHLRRAPRAHPRAGEELRDRVHGADERARA